MKPPRPIPGPAAGASIGSGGAARDGKLDGTELQSQFLPFAPGPSSVDWNLLPGAKEVPGARAPNPLGARAPLFPGPARRRLPPTVFDWSRPMTQMRIIKGVAVAPGLALGPVHVVHATPNIVPTWSVREE